MVLHLVPMPIHLAEEEAEACGLEGALQPEAPANSTYTSNKRQQRL